MDNTLNKLSDYRIIPVVVIKNTADLKPIIDGLVCGGLPVAEITFRTACAEQCIVTCANEYKNIIVGAGTVLNASQAAKAIKCGSKFVVGPGFCRDVADVCKEQGVPYIPGCVTPTEIMAAMECGIEIIKFFPANLYGGVKALKTFSSVFSCVKFVPTGGINRDNLQEYLELKNVFAAGGSWMVAGSPEEISDSVKEAINIKNSITNLK